MDLAYSGADGERKGFVWMRIGDLLLARGEFQQALGAADKAISLSRGRYFVLSSMELKFRVLRNLQRMTEARQIAASLLDEGFVLAEPSELLAAMARADVAGGNLVEGLEEFRRAIARAPGRRRPRPSGGSGRESSNRSPRSGPSGMRRRRRRTRR